MTDLSTTIAPKSDQLNSDDLIGRSLTVTITKVSAGSAEQPIAVNFENDNGKPYYPSKGMRRIMVLIWGPDGNAYTGRSMTLYREATVKFGGIQVGGIRISHMSHMDKDVTTALTETKANKKPFTVKVLRVAAPPLVQAAPAAALKPKATFEGWLGALQAELGSTDAREQIEDICARDDVRATLASAKVDDEKKAKINAAIKAALDRFDETDMFAGDETEAAEPGFAA